MALDERGADEIAAGAAVDEEACRLVAHAALQLDQLSAPRLRSTQLECGQWWSRPLWLLDVLLVSGIQLMPFSRWGIRLELVSICRAYAFKGGEDDDGFELGLLGPLLRGQLRAR